jgi:phosphatidylglycerophosphatase A
MITFIKKTLATGFYTGYLPAGGTAGTLVGIGIFLLLQPLVLYILLFILIPGGIMLSTWAERYFNKKDSGKIVIDEITGYLIAMAGISLPGPVYGFPSAVIIAASFILFRFFDIAKPFYIREIQKLEGGAGVMMDDILAGIYTNLVLRLLLLFLGW